ncbi:MAG: hypothetical protein KDA62_22935, partial [Planctomycetales bacterium]|nr:hypothetical protein [Planctomycetales bacterium]
PQAPAEQARRSRRADYKNITTTNSTKTTKVSLNLDLIFPSCSPCPSWSKLFLIPAHRNFRGAKGDEPAA